MRLFRLLPLLALLLTALPAAAHPPEYESSGKCPCIEVFGSGQRTAVVTLSRTTKVFQNNLDLDLRSVPLRGWVMSDARGRLVAGYVLVNDPRLTEFHTIAPPGPVVLPPGRYTVTRLTTNDTPVRIPTSGPAIRVVAKKAAPVRVARAHAAGPAAASAKLDLPAGSRVVFSAGGQNATAHGRLDTCVSRALPEPPACTTVEGPPGVAGTSAVFTSTTLLRGDESSAVSVGSGIGTGGVATATALAFR